MGQPNGLAVSSSYVFESPLIEQGTVLLDTAQDTSTFALHQQYFHKSLCLLLEHGDGYASPSLDLGPSPSLSLSLSLGPSLSLGLGPSLSLSPSPSPNVRVLQTTADHCSWHRTAAQP